MDGLGATQQTNAQSQVPASTPPWATPQGPTSALGQAMAMPPVPQPPNDPSLGNKLNTDDAQKKQTGMMLMTLAQMLAAMGKPPQATMAGGGAGNNSIPPRTPLPGGF